MLNVKKNVKNVVDSSFTFTIFFLLPSQLMIEDVELCKSSRCVEPRTIKFPHSVFEFNIDFAFERSRRFKLATRWFPFRNSCWKLKLVHLFFNSQFDNKVTRNL